MSIRKVAMVASAMATLLIFAFITSDTNQVSTSDIASDADLAKASKTDSDRNTSTASILAVSSQLADPTVSATFEGSRDDDSGLFGENLCGLAGLSEENKILYLKLTNEWDRIRGAVYENSPSEYFHTNNAAINYAIDSDGSGYLLAPYKYESTVSLEKMAKGGDTLAMLQLLNVQDLNLAKREWYAYQLLIHDKTALSLVELVSVKLANALVEYETKGYVSKDIKSNITDAITYVRYGLTRLDSGGLNTYLANVRENPVLSGTLHPAQILSDGELKIIDGKVEALGNYINQKREELYLEPIEDTDFPYVAHSQFSSRLGVLMSIYNEELDTKSFSTLFNPEFHEVTDNECVALVSSKFAERAVN